MMGRSGHFLKTMAGGARVRVFFPPSPTSPLDQVPEVDLV
jgi:hypothetical protein